METATLAARWHTLREKAPGMRTRDAAARLGVSEAELLATGLGANVTRLDADSESLLHALPEVGRCMALTRNDHATSEVRGRYGGVKFGGPVGQVTGEHIDLRVFLGRWHHTFAVEEPHPHHPSVRRRSIHVFDQFGTAVHKIYLEADGDPHTWDAIVASRTARLPLVIERTPAKRRELEHTEIVRDRFLAEWDAMTDTHEFQHLLRKHGLTRTQALRIAGRHRGRRVRNDSLNRLLHEAAATATRIMIFVGNHACIQVFSGTVDDIVKRGPWLNVLDPNFNLHVREDMIASSWVVSKPTRAGVVSSLELFDAEGETIALVFRKRDDRDTPEDSLWRGLLDRLEDAS